jgi:signal-transduction protein with cAMP-binding, CBS, and nucleotidyltransferase domain
MKFLDVLFGESKKPAKHRAKTPKKHSTAKPRRLHKHVLLHHKKIVKHHKKPAKQKKHHKQKKHSAHKKLHQHKRIHRHIKMHRHKARILQQGVTLKLSEITLANKALYVEDTLLYAIDFFSKNKLLVAPVITGRTVVGIVTIDNLTDAINYIGMQKLQAKDKTPISNMMQKKMYYIQSSRTVSQAIEKMISKNIENMVVFNKNDFLGILNRDEIFTKIAELLHKPNKTPSPEIETDIDDFYFKIIEKPNSSADYFAKSLNVSRDTIEEWGTALAEHGLVEIVYSPFGNIHYRIKKRAET